MSHSILTRDEYNARIEALSELYPCLRNPASSINVPPGWLCAVEELLRVISSITTEIEFVRIDRFDLMNTLSIFVETGLPKESARGQAISHEIDKARQIISKHTCMYCGDSADDFHGKCDAHGGIISGLFDGEIVYEDSDGYEPVRPDAVTFAKDYIQVAAYEMQSVHKAGADQFDLAQVFLGKLKWGDAISQDVFESRRKELMDGLRQAFAKEPVAKPKLSALFNDGRERPTLKMYSMESVEDLQKKGAVLDRKRLIEPYCKTMKELGPERYFAIISETWREDLDELEHDFPNFVEVIGFIRQQFALAAAGDGRVYFPPLLLNGPAGVGKTFFAKSLANLIKTTYCEIHMESEQNGAALVGTSAFWANTTPGKIADSLLLKEAANPVVVVDELDKAAGDARYDPLSGLYSLLEPITSIAFEDLCLGIQMNASGICWVMTSNEVDKIPLPILSRLRVFNVPKPTIEQIKHIARRIYSSLLMNHWGKAFEPELPDDVVIKLGFREPRVIRNTLLYALGNAAIEGRFRLEVRDLETTKRPALLRSDGSEYPKVQMFSNDSIEEMVIKGGAPDRKQLIAPYAKTMRELGAERYFAIVQDSWREDLDGMEQDFPNFVEVIGFIRQQFALTAAGDGRVYFPPLLLNGPSGIGKTLFAKTLASLIRTTYCEIHMESEQSGAALVGTSAFWANTTPGKIADTLLMKDSANPVVVVDELDKAAGEVQYDPLAGLYSLLEPGTSVEFEDLCLGIQMNASGICWIMTSNEVSRIPLPILSRLRVFNVPAPTIEQIEHIARRIYSSLLMNHWGKAFEPELPDDVVFMLGLCEPREIRNTLVSALGNAAIDGRSRLEIRDLDGINNEKSGGDYQATRISFVRAA